jgi:predicted nucleotidyltransferase
MNIRPDKDYNQELVAASNDSLAHDLYELLLLNSMRGKTLVWGEVYALTGLLPTQISNCLSRYTYSTPIDPLWTLTQSAKNYSRAYFNTDLTERVIQSYSHKEQFRVDVSHYGLATRFVSGSIGSQWYVMSRYNDWFWKQLFSIHYFNSLARIQGVQEVRLISSSVMRCSAEMSDIDIMIKTNPRYIYSTRLWAKFVLLKLTGRDVHLLYAEVLLWLSAFLRGKLAHFYSAKLHQQNTQHLKTLIARHKYSTKKTKIDIGIVYDNVLSLESNYGYELRQSLWLWQNALICSDIKQLNNALLHPHDHILYNHHQQNLITFKNTVISVLGNIIWYLAYPLNYLQKAYYGVKKPDPNNYVVNQNIIGFVPRIYKEGYYTNVTFGLTKTKS